MKIQQLQFCPERSEIIGNIETNTKTNLVFCFGCAESFSKSDLISIFPNADIVGCTTAGEIHNTNIHDHCLTITAIEFEKTNIHTASEAIHTMEDSEIAGKRLGQQLPNDNLKHVFIISDGLNINGTSLVKGLQSTLPKNISITGGMAGDGFDFNKTQIWHNEALKQTSVIAIGFYGEHLEVGYGSAGGWDSFGVDRLVTRSEGNVLYELDGKSALELYKTYLGKYVKDLPSSALLFPLEMRQENSDTPIIRTILGIDEDNQSMTFAGDIPQGAAVRFMKANMERLIDGAQQAAQQIIEPVDINGANTLSILISCVGRRLVLKQRAEEEIEIIKETLGSQTVLSGFYSYGEICPSIHGGSALLHNQTMTITTIREHT